MEVDVRVKYPRLAGLQLIGPSDSDYEGRYAALMEKRGFPEEEGRTDFTEPLKPFSAFLRNVSEQAIVGYWLRWEMMWADGAVNVRGSGGLNPRALMDGGPPGFEHLRGVGGFAIPPGGAKLVTLVDSFGEEDSKGSGIMSIAGGVPDHGYIDDAAIEENAHLLAELKRFEDQRSALNSFAAELRKYKSITISLDGAFFEEGTFVGPNETGFLGNTKVHLEAYRYLLNEISSARGRNDSNEAIFERIEEQAAAEADLRIDMTSADYYNFYKKTYAEEMLSIRAAMDAERAILMALRTLRHPWPVLRRQ